MKTVYAIVHGIVQGVGYRELVRSAASGLGIRGSVKNEADGSVSVIAIGDEKSISRFLEYIKVDFQPAGPSVFEIELVKERPDHKAPDGSANDGFAVVR